jgi:hypothetical protein
MKVQRKKSKKKEPNLLERKKFRILIEEIVQKKDDKEWENEELIIK